MQATPSPSALAASDELSQAPVCQGGRAHGVYAPVHDEEASDAVHIVRLVSCFSSCVCMKWRECAYKRL